MNIVQIILLAISSNLDDLGLGFYLGLKQRIYNRYILIIALISAITMLVGLVFGQKVSSYITDTTASYISALIFIVFGLWFIVSGYKSEDKEEETTKATNWTYKSAIMLGLALGIDSISLGVSAGFAHYPILLTSFFAGITSFLFIWTGSNFANRITFTLIKDKSDIVSGILLITLGIWQII